MGLMRYCWDFRSYGGVLGVGNVMGTKSVANMELCSIDNIGVLVLPWPFLPRLVSHAISSSGENVDILQRTYKLSHHMACQNAAEGK